jgi:glycosyltransferase involved in cell wall biosynthesis
MGNGKRIRVAVMTKQLDNWVSGSGHHLDELMKHVLRLSGGDMEFTFVHYKKSENPIYREVNELIVPRSPFAASRIIRRKRFDIVHYSNLSVFAPLWGVEAKKTATVHGIEEILFPRGYSLVHRLHETRYRPLLMRLMDGIATVSERGKRYLAARYRIPAEKIFVTFNAVSPAYRVLPPEERRPVLPAALGKNYILHISRYSERKNPRTIMKGFARFIRETGKDYFLVCAGKGWDGKEARRIAEGEGILDRYHAPGFISEDDAVELLNGAGVFLFPSFAEGAGMPNLEAMACGCPVITSNVFAIPEITGGAALLLSRPVAAGELAEGIRRILEDEPFRRDLVSRGFERAKAYSWDESARTLIRYWRGLVPGD